MRLLHLFLACSVLLLGVPGLAAGTRMISGELTVLERMALSQDAVILIDLRGADDRAVAVRRFLTDGAQSPFAFQIEAPEDSDLVLRAGLRAEGDQLWLSEPMVIRAGSSALDMGPLRVVRVPHMGYTTLLSCGNTLVELGFMPDQVRVRLNEQVLTMEAAPAPAGGSYFVSAASPATSLNLREDSAILRVDGAELSECRVLRPEADFTEGVWNISALGDKPTLFPSRTELVLFPDGRLSGSIGCNRVVGSYRRHGGILSFGRLAATRMACSEGLVEQEALFFELLAQIDGYDLDLASGRLSLTAAGRTVISARR
ncbi:MAG: META domain-containing protein [Roseinatronobacter sp.]